MEIDLPSLIMVTTLILVVSAAMLAAHWSANRTFTGLGRLAVGMALAAGGFLFLVPFPVAPAMSAIVAGDLMLLMAHLFFWQGIADFGKERSRVLTYFSSALMLIAIATLSYDLLSEGTGENRTAMFFFFLGLFSLGAALTVTKALGGRVGLYKGIIKRKTIGSSIVAAVFFGHAAFAFYRAVVLQTGENPFTYYDNTMVSAVTQLEAILVALGLSVSLIVATAERVQEDLRIQAMKDPLTQALNRRAFMMVLKTVLARSRRLSEPVSLIMMDIDKFKRINLKHGHLVGDAILGQFAEGVMEGRRAQDIFCRFGGEEFVLLLPGTEEEGAELVTRRVRDAVTGYPFTQGKKDISLTVSFGVTTARGEDLLSDSILDAAYKALRLAQSEGRNHIEIASNKAVSVS